MSFPIAVQIVGSSHVYASGRESNDRLGERFGLAPDALLRATGIRTRAVCGPGENVISLGTAAVADALTDAGLPLSGFDSARCGLIHVQNGIVRLTPPAGIQLLEALGVRHTRPISLDGVCTEPLTAFEIASLYLDAGLLDLAVVSAAADFIGLVDPNDPETAALFGAGAGAVVLQRTSPGARGSLRSCITYLDTGHADLGIADILGHSRSSEGQVTITASSYRMKGKELARVALGVVPRVVRDALDAAGVELSDITAIATHQPNPKLTEIGARRIGLDLDKIHDIAAEVGNLGPATIMASLDLARRHIVGSDGLLLAVAFGLGFSCTAAVLET